MQVSTTAPSFHVMYSFLALSKKKKKGKSLGFPPSQFPSVGTLTSSSRDLKNVRQSSSQTASSASQQEPESGELRAFKRQDPLAPTIENSSNPAPPRQAGIIKRAHNETMRLKRRWRYQRRLSLQVRKAFVAIVTFGQLYASVNRER